MRPLLALPLGPRGRPLLALWLLCAACSVNAEMGGEDGEEEAQEEPDRRILVEAATVSRGEVADHLATSGSLESEAQADLVPEATGVVTRILVEEGDSVEKGQLLAVLSNPSLDAGAQRAQVEIERIRHDAEVARSLHARGALSDGDLRIAESALKSAEASFAEAAATADFTRIESPIAGTVAIKDLRIGELAGQRRAFQVVDLARLRVVVQLPEKDLDRVHQGQSVLLQGAYDEETRGHGKVSRISPVVDASSGTVRVTIDVDASSTDLRPGQFVKARIEVDRHADVLTIPRRALVWVDGDPVAWKVVEGKAEDDKAGAEGEADEKADGAGKDADETPWYTRLFSKDKAAEADKAEEPPPWPLRQAERADLEIGFQDPEWVEVKAGLAEGDRVVTVGNQNLRGGTPLRLPEDPGPEARKKKDEAKDAPKADGEAG